MTPSRVEKMKKALMRSNTHLLLSAVMVFQFLAMLLIAFQRGGVNVQALCFAVALPLGTWLVTTLMGRVWPVDRAILILVLLLCSVGLISLSDIAKANVTPRTQAIYAVVGIAAMFIGAAFIRAWRNWKRYTPLLMVLCLMVLASPYLPVIGVYKYGARNWIGLGGFSVQPSEFMKPVLILCLASGFSQRPRFVKCIPTIAFAAACCGILLAEKDLGAVLLYFLTTVLMYYAATSNAFITLSGLGMGAGAAVIAYHALPYVQARVAIWQNPWIDPQDSGFQLIQSLIAIGSGGLFGKGFLQGTQTTYGFVPEQSTDFIFCTVGEEWGFLGCLTVILLYVFMIWRILNDADRSREAFTRIYGFCLAACLFMHLFINIGMTIGLMPVIGIPLPLLSYGGSSLWAFSVMIFIFIALDRQEKKYF